MSPFPIKVGIVGQGRSGWGIHASALQNMPERYQIAAVIDLDEARRQEARQSLGCRAYVALPDLLDDPEVELVVVAAPTHLHAAYSVAALYAGKEVVCEKPMAATLADACSMAAAAERTGSLLTIFQNRRYQPSYRKVREVIASGKLGRIVEIKLTAQSFARRWDWQTLQTFGGGMLRNNGIHYLDQALQLMDLAAGHEVEPEVFYAGDRALALGDAEDHFKLILRASGAPLADIELTSACAYVQEPWLVMGTQGTLAGSDESLRWKYFRPDELEPHKLSTAPTEGRRYNADHIPFIEETWTADPAATSMTAAFYLDLYSSVREGAPLTVAPASVLQAMRVIEQCG